jgi:hypothetical protein
MPNVNHFEFLTHTLHVKQQKKNKYYNYKYTRIIRTLYYLFTIGSNEYKILSLINNMVHAKCL